MTDQELDPVVVKLLEYAKEKKSLSWDELNSLLPDEIANSEKMDGILVLLEKNNIQLIEDDPQLEELDDDTVIQQEEIQEQQDERSRKQLVYNEKDSNGDDPIRLYLREIGKEHLLTAEQEVILSKRMENGENIIKNVIKNSGMMIPEFFAVAQKAFSRIDPHEAGKPR